ncbi:YdcF family protein [Bacteroidota bacterium]
MLYFERFLAALFSPLPIIFIFLFIGIILLLTSKKHNLGKGLLIIAVFLFIFFSFSWITQLFIEPAEEKYQPYSALYSQLRSDINNSGRPLKWIVVLGGGISNDENIPLTSRLSYPTLTRLIEGIRLHRKFPGSKLVLSGGSPEGGTVREADLMKKLAVELGVERFSVMTENTSLETVEQAQEIKKIVKDDSFVLVTSANHMPRAEAMFLKQGMHPYVMPADFIVKNSEEDDGFGIPLPNSHSFKLAEQVFYELWAKIGAAIKGDT